MSQPFDPDKVRRTIWLDDSKTVDADDYDSLLSLYRVREAEIQRLSQSQDHLLATGEGLAAQLETMRKLLKDFVSTCLHCGEGPEGEIVPCLLCREAEILLAPKAEEVEKLRGT